MLDDTASKTAGSPEWWLLRLGKRLADDADRFDRLERYWRGDPPYPFGNQRMREAYRRLQRLARTNFGSLIAEAVLERMKVMGFRAGADADEEVDKSAWEWWQANGLDADAGLVHRAAVVLSRAYVIVGKRPPEDEEGDDEGDDEGGRDPEPLVTVEDPRQVIHESHPTDRRRVMAAMKTYWDDISNTQIAVLFLPRSVHYFEAVGIRKDTTAVEMWRAQRWRSTGTIDNPLGEVPVVPFINRPDMAGEGLGEFEDVIDVLDRINTSILDRMVISAMQAYRQRWAKGVSLQDEDGNDTSAFDPGADLLWAVEDENAQFGEFSTTDLTSIVKSIESDVQYLSAITRTPPHYILAGIVNASGDALSVAETGLTSKVVEREQEFGESWERVYRLAAKTQGRTIGTDAEVVWKNPQFRSLTEMASANAQLKAADVPWRTRMRLLDMTPQDIERMEAERMQDAMTMAMMQPLLAPPQQGPFQPTIPGQSGNGARNPNGAGGAGQVARRPAGSSVSGQRGTANTAGNRDAGTSGTALPGGDGASWDSLYQRARRAGVRGASKMTKAQLRAAIGG